MKVRVWSGKSGWNDIEGTPLHALHEVRRFAVGEVERQAASVWEAEALLAIKQGELDHLQAEVEEIDEAIEKLKEEHDEPDE